MITAKQAIYDQQRKWAANRGIKPDAKGYTQTVEENLFQPLTPAAQADYDAGRGNELGNAAKPGKMQSAPAIDGSYIAYLAERYFA